MKLFPPNAMSGQHCKNYDVKQETVHCYPRNVDRCCTSFVNSVIIFHRFDPFALLYNKPLNDWSLVNFVSPSGPVIKCLLYCWCYHWGRPLCLSIHRYIHIPSLNTSDLIKAGCKITRCQTSSGEQFRAIAFDFKIPLSSTTKRLMWFSGNKQQQENW